MYTKPTAGEPSRIVPRPHRRGTWMFVGANALAVLLIWLLYRFRASKKTAG
jgi:hypothetical protein